MKKVTEAGLFSSNAPLHHADVVEDLVDRIDKGDLITCLPACTSVQRKAPAHLILPAKTTARAAEFVSK
ncbi:hypothetical protein [Paraburkholderia sp. RAU2J]|uniref:hypothetical protein n=1 Tax=Paraburkholderia sp. RAU2J TaxID=1938810 RepID=UPI0011C4056A|nr:hypothetical protein [Paraburkholderia sp. RAU2J]